MAYSRTQRLATWAVSLGFVALALMYLNGAFFSAWMSGGPPNPHPLGWERRALGQLSLSAACFVLAVGSFGLVRSLPSLRRVPLALLTIGVVLALAPYVGRFLLQDGCLDQGGQWSNLTLECKTK
jgi:hypothetical protein